VLRVSAPFGLSSLQDLNREIAGSSANALELMVDPVSRHAEVVRVDGSRVLYRVREGGPPATELAAALRAPGLQTTTVDASGNISAEFDTQAHANVATLPSGAGFALGPYELEDENLQEGWVKLRSREHSAIDIIEVIAVDATEQWRRLHARNVDVVPASPSSSRDAYAGMSSVRTIDYPVTGCIAVLFNVRRAPIADVATRRELAAIIDPRAAAATACRDPDCASRLAVRPARTGKPLPPSLRILVLASDSVAVDVARVVRLQLEAAGVRVALQRVDIDQLSEQIKSADFELMIGPLPYGPGVFPFVQGDSPLNMIGWSNTDLDAAIARNDVDAVMEILATEVPILPLVDDRQFAVVDSRLCGGRPIDASWRWLADVYPCDAESRP
jgi:hypothetical protein